MKLQYRRFNVTKTGNEYLRGKIAGSDFLEIKVGEKRYVIGRGRGDSLLIECPYGPVHLRPHSRYVSVGADD